VAVPGDKDSPNLITELEAMALKYKIIIPAIQIADGSKAAASATSATESASANAVSVSIAINGSFENLNAFVASIEKDIRFMNIKSLSITSNEEDPNKMSLTLQIEAYKRPAAVLTPAPKSSTSAAANAMEGE
jgi:Tfp pilus assembly protein PilO